MGNNLYLRAKMRRLEKQVYGGGCRECAFRRGPLYTRETVTLEEFDRREAERAKEPPVQPVGNPGACSACGKKWPLKIKWTIVVMPDGSTVGAHELRWLREHGENPGETSPGPEPAVILREAAPIHLNGATDPLIEEEEEEAAQVEEVEPEEPPGSEYSEGEETSAEAVEVCEWYPAHPVCDCSRCKARAQAQKALERDRGMFGRFGPL